MDDIVIESNGMVMPFDFDMIDDGTGAVEEAEVEVEEIEAEEVEEVVEEAEEIASDEETGEFGEDEVDYEAYEITLPDGEVVVMSDLVTGYKAAEEVRKEREAVESVKREFEEKSGGLLGMMELAQLEVDSVIQEYDDTDWEELATTDPASFADHRRYLDKHVRRSAELKKAHTELKEEQAREEKAAETAKLQNAVVRLQREITGWGDPMYHSLVEYGMSLGATSDELLQCTDPLVFIALHKAREVEKGKQAIKAKVKQVGTPKKVMKAAPKGQPLSEDAKRDAIIKKAQAEGDMASLFHLIKG